MARECEIVAILAARVARGDATAREREQVEAHLRSCPDCGKRRTRTAPEPRPPESSVPVPHAPEPAGPSSPRPLPKLPLAMFGALIAVALVATLFGSPRCDPDEPAGDAAELGAAVGEPGGLGVAPSETLDTDPAEPLAPENLELETLGPETRELETLGPETLGPETLGPGTLGPESLAPETLGTAQAHGGGVGVVDAAEPAELDAATRESVRGAAGELEASTPAVPAREPSAPASTGTSAEDCSALEGSAASESAPEARAAALLAAGDCWLATGESAAALRLYERVIAEHIDTASGPAALFNKGVACEALFRLCRIHVAAGRTEQALSCIQRYRRGYGDEAYVVDTHYLEGLALKDDPATRAAAADAFLAYIAGENTEHLDDALYWRAVALERAGDPRAAEAGRAFLERVGSGDRAAEIRTWLP